MENKYEVGEVVIASAHPEILLTIRRYVDRIYFCRVKDLSSEKDLVYFEREIERPKKDK